MVSKIYFLRGWKIQRFNKISTFELDISYTKSRFNWNPKFNLNDDLYKKSSFVFFENKS